MYNLCLITACVDGPCLNGGHCNQDNINFNCQCRHGYTGHLCETGYLFLFLFLPSIRFYCLIKFSL